jgi:aspartyl-tRNA(Asn)/glutamyl-tRNA(Gln) amidotransferase subunit A
VASKRDFTDLDLVQAAAAIESGAVDPVELTEAYLARIEATEPDLNAYVTVDVDGARQAAAAAREEIAEGRYRGPLHGIPVGIKDIFDTAGLRTTYGSIRYSGHVPTSDAVVVARIRSAGAVILGKQATHEFAWGGRTDNPHFGPTRNPRDLTRIPGGSSGGGAASVVARSSLLAIGSDTAGSVRIPAALCGCVGVKPVYGWIDMAGAFPLEPELDHVGVLARTVDDAALAVGVLGGPVVAGRRGVAPPVDRLRIGVLTGGSQANLDDAVRRGLGRALAALSAAGVELVEVPLDGIDERAIAILTTIKATAEAVHRSDFRDHPGSYGPDLADLLSGPAVSDQEREDARQATAGAVADLRAALGELDLLLSATVPITAPAIGAMTVWVDGESRPIEPILTRLTSIANAARWPAISVPAPPAPPGDGPADLPVGIQMLCAPGDVGALLRAANCVMGGSH